MRSAALKSAKFVNATRLRRHWSLAALSLLVSSCFAVPPGSFANSLMPTKEEAERADVQKRADQFFNRKPKSEADKALLYLQKYKPDLAIRVYARALVKTGKQDFSKKETREKAANILTLMGRSFKQDENDPVACNLYKMALKLDPSNITTKAFLVESLIPTAQFDQATKISKELDALKSDNPTVLRALANESFWLEDYETCNNYLDQALKAKDDPLRYVTLRLKAQCRIRQGIASQVGDFFRQSGEAAESPYEKELALGSAALASTKAAEADEHFQRASRMLPDDIAWLSGHIQALSMLPNRADEAYKLAIDAMQKRRLTNRSMIFAANALNAHQQQKAADKCLDRLKSLKYWSWHPYLAAGRIIRMRGDNLGAIKQLQMGQKINPKSGATALEIAAAYDCQKMPKQALDECRKKVVDCPHYIQLWIKRGSIALQLKQNAEAKFSFDEALRQMPKEASLNVVWKNEAAVIHAGLGTLAYMSGDKETAAKEAHLFNELKFVPVLPAWLTLINFRPGRLNFKTPSKKEAEAIEHTALADMLLETRQLKEVVAEYAKAVELNPSDVDLHSYYLNALVENNNWVEAAKEDFVLSSKIVGKASDGVAKWVKDKNAKKGTKAEPQGQKNGQGR